MKIWRLLTKPFPRRVSSVIIALIIAALSWMGWRYYLTPKLMHAIDIGDFKEVKRLIAIGADVNGHSTYETRCSCDSGYVTPLMWALEQKRMEIGGYLRGKGAHLTTWLDPDAVFHAAAYGDASELQRLIWKGKSLEWEDKVGQKLLHYAAWNGHAAVVKFLIDKGANVNSVVQLGSPLHYAIDACPEKNWDEVPTIIEILIAKGADLNIRNGEDKTPLALARKCAPESIQQLLVKHGAKE